MYAVYLREALKNNDICHILILARPIFINLKSQQEFRDDPELDNTLGS